MPDGGTKPEQNLTKPEQAQRPELKSQQTAKRSFTEECRADSPTKAMHSSPADTNHTVKDDVWHRACGPVICFLVFKGHRHVKSVVDQSDITASAGE
jgi:hypothetical protein